MNRVEHEGAYGCFFLFRSLRKATPSQHKCQRAVLFRSASRQEADHPCYRGKRDKVATLRRPTFPLGMRRQARGGTGNVLTRPTFHQYQSNFGAASVFMVLLMQYDDIRAPLQRDREGEGTGGELLGK